MKDNKETKNWEVISHTADYAFRIFGRSLEELINNAFSAFTASLFPTENAQSRSISETEIKVSSYEPALLVIDLLRELLYMVQSDNVFPLNFRMTKLNETEVVGYLNYRLRTPEDIQNVDIKAVTYHKARIEEMNDKFFMDIVCDV